MEDSDNKPYALHAVIVKKTVPKDEALQHAQNIIKKKAFKGTETKLTYRFRAIPKTKFIKESFRSKKINPDITLVFAELKPEFSKLTGRGFMDYFKRGYDYVATKLSTAKEAVVDTATSAKDKVASFLAPRQDYNNKTKEMLKQYGSGIVTKMTIMRKPVDAYITTVLNLVSLGKWNQAVKKEGFDKFFHLCLLCTVNNEELNVEKLDVVSISKNIYTGDTVEIQDVPLDGKEFTLEQLLETARENVGDEAFFYYDSFQNNCQSFVSYLLKGQGLYRPAEKAFVYQAIQGVIDDMPDYVKRFQRGLTDIAASFNKLSGQGIEDQALDKGVELAKGIGGENLFKKLGEDLGDMFSGERYGYTREKQAREKEEQAKAQAKAQEDANDERRRANPQQTETDDWANERQTNLTQELYEPWRAKFGQSITGYSPDYYPPSAAVFNKLVMHKGLKSKDEVEKLYAKVRADALKTLNKGDKKEAEKKYKQQESIYKQVYSGGAMLPFAETEEQKMGYDERLANELKKIGKFYGLGMSGNQPMPYGNLHELLRDLEGGNKAAGFIRAMMARRLHPEKKEEYKEINKKKFKNFDKEGFDINRMSKTTHNVALTSKPLTKDETFKTFYDYIVQQAPQHQPLRDGKINYVGTYDIGDMYDLWKQTVGVEKRQERKEKKEAPQPEVDIPASFFDLPEPKKAVNSPAVVIVPAEDLDDEKGGDKVVLGEFDNPKNAFEREINKLVNYGATYLHFDDLIANVLEPVMNPRIHSALPLGSDIISMYYLITKYKIPILEFGKRKLYIPKQLDQKKSEFLKDYNVKEVSMYNNVGYVSDITKNIPEITEIIKQNLDRGEQQILLRISISVGKSAHANVIIIRAIDKKIYIVDPHGTQELKKYKGQYAKQLSIMTKIAKKLKYTVVPSGESCPYPTLRKDVKNGFQAVENLYQSKFGFCGWWSFFIIEMCCLKPTVPFESLYAEARTLLSDDPIKIFNVIVKYQYNLQQITLKIAKEAGITITDKVSNDSMYSIVASYTSDKIGELLVKRKAILGYGELEGDGSRGYNFIRALNASKAPANTESESIVKWREENKDSADKINEGKFGKFDYDKVKKGTRDLAKRTKNVDPKKVHPPLDKSGLYDLKKVITPFDLRKGESERDKGIYGRLKRSLNNWREGGYYLENWATLTQKERKDAYYELSELIYAPKDKKFASERVMKELRDVDDFDTFDWKELPKNIKRAYEKWALKKFKD